MKKVLCLILTGILAFFAFSGCSPAPEVPSSGNTDSDLPLTDGFGGEEDGSEDEIPVGDIQLFEMERISDVRAYAEHYDLQMREAEGGYLWVNTAVCFGLPVQFEFTPGEDGETITMIRVLYLPFKDRYVGAEKPSVSYTGEELKGEIRKFLDLIDLQFNITIENSFFVASNADGSLLPNGEGASYDQIIAGKAALDFALLDETGYYWHLCSSLTEEGLVFLEFTNYFEDEARIANGAHITLK